mmetsp:Transcript_65563/g.109237  ORF Transcript_65563/g.109237 Transcript_65563/m.109237 type:complete len:133 (+) Transcript_65563:84-482(+)
MSEWADAHAKSVPDCPAARGPLPSAWVPISPELGPSPGDFPDGTRALTPSAVPDHRSFAAAPPEGHGASLSGRASGHPLGVRRLPPPSVLFAHRWPTAEPAAAVLVIVGLWGLHATGCDSIGTSHEEREEDP